MPVYECLRVCEHAVDVFFTESVIGMSGITLVWTPRVVGPLHLCVTSYLTWHANCRTSIGQPCVEPHAAGERARNSTERCSLKLQRPLSRDRFHFSYIISHVADLHRHLSLSVDWLHGGLLQILHVLLVAYKIHFSNISSIRFFFLSVFGKAASLPASSHMTLVTSCTWRLRLWTRQNENLLTLKPHFFFLFDLLLGL